MTTTSQKSASQATVRTPAATPRSITERPRFSLTMKIFVSVAALVFFALGGAVAISWYRARSVAESSIRKALSRVKDAFDNFQDDRYQKLHQAVRIVVDNAAFKGLVAEGDPATLANNLKEDQASAIHANFLIITDPQGISVVRTDKGDWRHDLSNSPMIKKALERSDAEGIWYSDGRLYQAVAAPVVSGESGGAIVNGVLIAAFAFDDKVAESFHDVSNTDVAFYANLARPSEPPKLSLASSTLGGKAKDFTSAFAARADLVGAVFQHGMTAGPVDIETGEDRYLGMAWPLRLSSGEIVGAVAAVRSLSTELAPFRAIENTLFAVGLAALLLAFLVSYLLARRVTGPIGEMVSATQAVREGEYEVSLPVDQKDEIGILARSFRIMIEELKEKAELEKQIASLTMGGVGGAAQKTVALSQATPGGSPSRLPRPGQDFAGRYEIQAELGVGGMGIVYKAHDRVLDDAVAIKVLRGEALAQDPTLIERFKQEIRLARKITHRNILRTHDFGETNGLHYLSMEYVRGITLKHLLSQSRRMPAAAGLRIARQVCAGLAAAHSAGVIHRDIKPQNMMIEPSGGLKIMDFGIARLTQDKGMTATGMVVGTPDYMSPEQARGVSLDQRSDIYSVGVVFYELFCGALPFEADSALGVVLKHIQEAPPVPENKNPEIDPRLSKIIMRAMAKNPEERYQSIEDLHQDLSEVTA
jgi:serine/threonine-protein kinase